MKMAGHIQKSSCPTLSFAQIALKPNAASANRFQWLRFEAPGGLSIGRGPEPARPCFPAWRSCAVTAVEPFDPGLDHGNLFVDLTDRQTEVIACSVFEIDGQPLTVQPEILDRPAVFHPNIGVNDLLDCIRHFPKALSSERPPK
jgi:hypothetical protein